MKIWMKKITIMKVLNEVSNLSVLVEEIVTRIHH